MAFFLWALEKCTNMRWHRPWLLYFLPIAGIPIVLGYRKAGKSIGEGNRLVIKTILDDGNHSVPMRIVPMVILGTLATHLFGGSAGREGTAVQMGGGWAAGFARLFFKLGKRPTALLLTCGIAAGFGAVFGTPFAASIFAQESVPQRKPRALLLLPSLIAALLADWVCKRLGAVHDVHLIRAYSITGIAGDLSVQPFRAIVKIACCAVCFGLAAKTFSISLDSIQSIMNRNVRPLWWQPVIGGCLIILLCQLFGDTDHIGLGARSMLSNGHSINTSFFPNGSRPFGWAEKMLLTTITLGSGFKGGEVTPLFFIGSALGNQLSNYFHLPTDLLAGLGFVSVFAAAAKTPFTGMILAIELFGRQAFPYFLVTIVVSNCMAGKKGIYSI